jgi:hypothetical protein
MGFDLGTVRVLKCIVACGALLVILACVSSDPLTISTSSLAHIDANATLYGAFPSETVHIDPRKDKSGSFPIGNGSLLGKEWESDVHAPRGSIVHVEVRPNCDSSQQCSSRPICIC